MNKGKHIFIDNRNIQNLIFTSKSCLKIPKYLYLDFRFLYQKSDYTNIWRSSLF